MIRRGLGDDRGSVVAEFAVALPAVALVLLLGAGALGACAQQVRLQDAAADAARLVARGESDARARRGRRRRRPGGVGGHRPPRRPRVRHRVRVRIRVLPVATQRDELRPRRAVSDGRNDPLASASSCARRRWRSAS